jgi:hypothetical protein
VSFSDFTMPRNSLQHTVQVILILRHFLALKYMTWRDVFYFPEFPSSEFNLIIHSSIISTVVKDHPVFQKPEDRNIKIWRFMDFTKYVSLLEKRALYFSRSDKLGDPFEGSLSKANQQMRPIWYGEHFTQMKEMLENVPKLFINHTFLNCWHVNEYESDAMWKIYLKSNEGIAIQSTFQRFENCFDPTPEDLYIGKVIYADYDKEIIPEGNTMWPFVHKRKSFEHERELRALIQRPPIVNGAIKWDVPSPHGMYVQVKLDTLIEKVYISPMAEKWFDELVSSVNEKYGVEKELSSSKLSERPIY